jgi:hypothetical protein
MPFSSSHALDSGPTRKRPVNVRLRHAVAPLARSAANPLPGLAQPLPLVLSLVKASKQALCAFPAVRRGGSAANWILFVSISCFGVLHRIHLQLIQNPFDRSPITS